MTTTAKRLVPGAILGTTPATLYTATGTAIVQKGTLVNASGGAVTVNLWLVPSGAAPGLQYQALANASIAAGATVSMRDSLAAHVIEAGGMIVASASSGGAVGMMVSGVEIT